MPLPLLMAVLVFVAALVSVTLLGWALRLNRDARERQIARRVGAAPPALTAFRERPRPEVRGEGAVASWLRQAGDPMGVGGLALRAAFTAGSGLAVTVSLLDGPAALIGLGAGALPVWSVARAAERRAADIASGLPPALDLMVRTLRAGHGIGDALMACGTELEGPAGEELGRVAEEMRLGRELREALDRLMLRNPQAFDLRLLSSALLLQRETGGNLVELLERLADTVRERVLFEGRVEALTAEVRFSAAVLVVLPFFIAAVLMLLRPDYLRPLVDTTMGQSMLLGAAVSLSVGVIVMRRLAQVEV